MRVLLAVTLLLGLPGCALVGAGMIAGVALTDALSLEEETVEVNELPAGKLDRNAHIAVHPSLGFSRMGGVSAAIAQTLAEEGFRVTTPAEVQRSPELMASMGSVGGGLTDADRVRIAKETLIKTGARYALFLEYETVKASDVGFLVPGTLSTPVTMTIYRSGGAVAYRSRVRLKTNAFKTNHTDIVVADEAAQLLLADLL